MSEEQNETKLSPQAQQKIQQELVQLLNSPELLGKFRFPQAGKFLDRIQIQLLHSNNISEIIEFKFTNDFPNQPPKVELKNSQVPSFLCYSSLLFKNNWTPQSRLIAVVLDIYSNLDKYYQHERCFQQKRQFLLMPPPNTNSEPRVKQETSQANLMDQESINVKMEESSERRPTNNNRKKTNQMNGCSDRELTETKNLNRHFRSKLREVLKDKASDKQHMQEYKEISQLFAPNRVGFEDIRRVLASDWFRKEVDDQMQNGRFLNKILRGTMGMKSKKLMIKYYHVMLSAVDKPESFVRWKYD